MSGYTKATWERDGNTVFALNRDGSNIFWATVASGYKNESGTRTSDAEIMANARLIAAAPELLKFAEEFVEAWADGTAGDSSFLLAARAAISKARGEA